LSPGRLISMFAPYRLPSGNLDSSWIHDLMDDLMTEGIEMQNTLANSNSLCDPKLMGPCRHIEVNATLPEMTRTAERMRYPHEQIASDHDDARMHTFSPHGIRDDGCQSQPSRTATLTSKREQDEASTAQRVAAAVYAAKQRPDGPGAMGHLIQLAPLGQQINKKQQGRILARRRCKVKQQAERVLRGYLEGSKMKHVSRQDHARRRVRGPHGRFLGAEELVKMKESEAAYAEAHPPDAEANLLDASSHVDQQKPMFLQTQGLMRCSPAPPGEPLPGVPLAMPAEHALLIQQKEAMLASMHATSQMLLQQQLALKQLEGQHQFRQSHLESLHAAVAKTLPYSNR